MRFVLLVCLLFSAHGIAIAQENPPVPKPAAYYLKMLEGSKDSLYQQILAGYEAYLAVKPNDYRTLLEQCKLIDQAFYDSYEEYNPREEEAAACRKKLLKRFPNQLEVILYQADYQWGDSLYSAMQRAISLNGFGELRSDTDLMWMVHEKLATHRSYDDEYLKVIAHGTEAMKLNDTLDLSRIVAESHYQLGQNEEALAVLLKYKDQETSGWELSEKGKLLLQMEEPEQAMDLFERALADTANAWFDKTFLARTFLENGRPSEARTYFLNEAEGPYAGVQARIDLFLFDLEHSSADSLKKSYELLVDDNFWHDPFGKFRWRMFAAAPGLSWSFDDILRVFSFLLLLGFCILLPYLWVLPVYALGHRLRSKGRLYEPLDNRWGLKQFWLLSSALLLAEILATYFYGYQSFVIEYNATYLEEDLIVSEAELANSDLLFMTLLMVSTFAFLRISDIKTFWGEKWSMSKSIGYAFLAVFCLRLLAGIISAVQQSMDELRALAEPGFIEPYLLSVVESIQAVNSHYGILLGFLTTVILVPIYEEYIFRGVFLSAMQRNIGFFWANLIQAVFFAMVHEDWSLFIFYVAFGMAAGYLRKSSGSMSASIIMHMLNNLIAFLAILALG